MRQVAIEVIEGCVGTIAPKADILKRRNRLREHPFLSRFALVNIEQVTIDEVSAAFLGKVPEEILEVLFLSVQEAPFHVFFWRAGEHYFYDEDIFGEVVDILDLTYDSKYGLGSRLWDDDDEEPEEE